MEINEETLKVLKKHSIFLDEYYILWCKYFDTDWLKSFDTKPFAYNKLLRLGYLTDNLRINEKGRQAFTEIVTTVVDVVKEENKNEKFEAWWNLYPSTDAHGMWPKTRIIRTNKPRSKKLYIDLLKEGISEKTLETALLADVKMRKRDTKQNSLRYMKSPAAWLYQREFENFTDEEPSSEFSTYGKDVE